MTATAAHSVVAPSARSRRIAGTIVILYALVSMVPLVWIFLTSIKTPPDSISYPPKILFQPSLEGYCNLFTTRSRQTAEYIAALPPAENLCDDVARSRNMVVAGPIELRAALRQLAHHRLRLDGALGAARHGRRLRLLALQGAVQG